ncbi:hypothetical protein [Agaribacterium haliotis]|uniref:hypothetical protein n=1 Tax=Agaribacterium haliotis TaxID=2013869 RepID=UPI000BB53186|nr:hypothetical protein [Agaribacterium haliotis]
MRTISLVFYHARDISAGDAVLSEACQAQLDALVQAMIEFEATKVEQIAIGEDGLITAEQWLTLDASDAIVFASSTSLGSIAWQFEKFAIDSHQRHGDFNLNWQNKLAAGFSFSDAPGDEGRAVLNWLVSFAMRHLMLWVGCADRAISPVVADDIRYGERGGQSGLTLSTGSSLLSSPLAAGTTTSAGVLSHCRNFGQRIAERTHSLPRTALDIAC